MGIFGARGLPTRARIVASAPSLGRDATEGNTHCYGVGYKNGHVAIVVKFLIPQVSKTVVIEG